MPELINEYPLYIAIIICAFMFFIAVAIRGWPESLFGWTFGDDNEEEKEDDIDGLYFTLERTVIEFDEDHIPTKIGFKIRKTEYPL